MDMHVYDTWLFAFSLLESSAIVLGNGFLVVTFFRHRSLLNAMNCYICSMCFSGLITGFIVPTGVGNYIGSYTISAGLFLSKCTAQKVKACIFYATACNSILCMLAIAAERWRTLSANSRIRRVPANVTSKLVVATAWLLSLIYAVALHFIFHLDEVPIQYEGSSTNSCINANQTSCGDFKFCYFSEPDYLHLAEIFHLTTLVLVFIVPLCAISIIYTILVVRLLRNAERSEKTNRGSCSIHRAKLRAIQAMVLVVVIFAICWLPCHIFLVWMVYHPHRLETGAPFHRVSLGLRIGGDFVIHLVITHHWIQTFIYPRYSRQLANALKETAGFIFSFGRESGSSQAGSKTSKYSNPPATA